MLNRTLNDSLLRAGLTVVAISLSLACADALASEASENKHSLTAILSGSIPADAADLRAMQAHVQSLTPRLVAATVAVQAGHAHGSGVVISGDGFVLTAAHVVGKPNLAARIIMADGRELAGTTLGVYRTLDAGLIRIAANPTSNPWPHVKMGSSADVTPGQWCLATGHPGGFRSGRQPVVRLGRILSLKEDATIHTDCTLIGGDSGGPLFDMQGQVIGVHSRIAGPLNVNLHVPVGTYSREWNRLTRGDSWGHIPGTRPYIGVYGVQMSQVAKISEVPTGTPADKAGLRKGDVVVQFAGKPVTDFDSLKSFVADEQPGNQVSLTVLRDGQRIVLHLVIGDNRE